MIKWLVAHAKVVIDTKSYGRFKSQNTEHTLNRREYHK